MTDVLSSINAIQRELLPANMRSDIAGSENTQFESIEYSYFSGGKRFRPMLSFATADYLGLPIEKIFPWAMAIEMIHTYSLIHDDLPSMDNDDFRRGKPTNHKMFGEAVALLSGDALLTEAFALLARHYSEEKDLGALIQSLVHVSGVNGMILGQYFDISLDGADSNSSISNLNKIHLLKTGALISGSVLGPVILKRLSSLELKSMRETGFLMGYAFQVKDDILDAEQDQGSKKNLTHYFQNTQNLGHFLARVHQEIESKIAVVDKYLKNDTSKSACLTQFLKWNADREL